MAWNWNMVKLGDTSFVDLTFQANGTRDKRSNLFLAASQTTQIPNQFSNVQNGFC